ncbi:GntR family transcriptional regulator [Streptomyces sp. NBC_00647]|uniref:GntR family transcriptional regulator n=1 Tax=Streptomyces sp. NBC_00647 TaxID=2975796 RepID=UPI0032473910
MEQAGPRGAHPSVGVWGPEIRTGAHRVPPQPGAADAGRARVVPAGDGAGPDAGPGGGPAMASARGEHTHSEVPIPRPRAEDDRAAVRTDDTRSAVRTDNARPAHGENARPARGDDAHPVQAEKVRPARAEDARPAVRPEAPRPVVQRASVRGQILDALRTALVAGELAPGEVYSAPALGERFGVSATPVREAMQQLALEGAVEVVPNRGFRVIERGTRELAELAEIRGLIEVPVMLRLARTVPAARWAELRPLAEATVRAASSGCRATYAESDRSFHRAVLALAGNAQLVRIADDLHRRAQWPLVGGPVSRGRADLVADAAEHTALLEALIAEDLAVVQSLVREHFAGAS